MFILVQINSHVYGSINDFSALHFSVQSHVVVDSQEARSRFPVDDLERLMLILNALGCACMRTDKTLHLLAIRRKVVWALFLATSRTPDLHTPSPHLDRLRVEGYIGACTNSSPLRMPRTILQ